jgi:hypothetical protein
VLSLGVAHAGAPTVAMCEGTDLGAWVGEQRVVPVAAGEPADATCRVVEGGWELRVRGNDGLLRGVTVLEPTTDATREAFVAATWALLEASGWRAEPQAPAAPMAPPELAPEVPPEPVASAPPVEPVGTTEPVSPARPAPWLSMSPRIHYRLQTDPTVAISMSAGAFVLGQLWIGPEFTVLPTRGIPDQRDADAIKDFVAEARVGWSPLRPGAKVAPQIQAGFGLAAHQWQLEGAVVQATVAPVLSVDAGVALFPFRDSPRTAIVPFLRAGVDLGTTQVGGTRGVPVALSPLGAEVGVSLRAMVE